VAAIESDRWEYRTYENLRESGLARHVLNGFQQRGADALVPETGRDEALRHLALCNVEAGIAGDPAVDLGDQPSPLSIQPLKRGGRPGFPFIENRLVVFDRGHAIDCRPIAEQGGLGILCADRPDTDLHPARLA
jgi:hypothetical protein